MILPPTILPSIGLVPTPKVEANKNYGVPGRELGRSDSCKEGTL